MQIQKTIPGLLYLTGPRREHLTDQRHKLYRTNYDNFIKFWKTLEDTIRFQSDPVGQVINLSAKRFCKDTFKFLNINFVPTQNTINKNTIHKQFENFFRRIKLRTHFKNKKMKTSLLKKIDPKNQEIKTLYPPTVITA